MNRFAVPTTVDYDLCIRTGQVFRWCKEGSVISGTDGSIFFRISEGVCESNGSVQEFNGLFNLAWDDEAAARTVAGAAPETSPYLHALAGLRLMQPADPVEVFFSFLCTANNHLARIGPMVRKLGAYGDPLGEFRVFPRTDRIAKIPEQELRDQGFGYRGRSISLAARTLMERGGDDYLTQLRNADYCQAHEELLSIPYIGRKLSDCICLYGLHKVEAVPIDTHLWQIATRLFFPELADRPLTERRYLQVGSFFRERFGKYAGWAHQRLYVANLQDQPRRRKLK